MILRGDHQCRGSGAVFDIDIAYSNEMQIHVPSGYVLVVVVVVVMMIEIPFFLYVT
jgi:hypothetical protein